MHADCIIVQDQQGGRMHRNSHLCMTLFKIATSTIKSSLRRCTWNQPADTCLQVPFLPILPRDLLSVCKATSAKAYLPSGIGERVAIVWITII